jgi:hypothetical protein
MNRCLKNPAVKFEKIVQKLLSEYVAVLPDDLKHTLTPYHSKHPHLYGLPKMHKPYIPLRPTGSSTGSTRSALAGLLCKIMTPGVGKSEPFVKKKKFRTFHTIVIVRKSSKFIYPSQP